MERVLQHTSFWALDADTQASVRNYANGRTAFPHSLASVYRQRNALACARADALVRVAQWDEAMLPFLTPEQRLALEGELMFAHYVLSATYQLNVLENNAQAVKQAAHDFNHCARLLHRLRGPSAPLMPSVATTFVRVLPAELALAIRQELTAFNARRLYWVWASALIAMLLNLLKQTVNPGVAFSVLQAISSITTPVSWILYFMRFGLVLVELLRQVLSPAQQACGLTWQERLYAQWQLYKYTLLNDSIWGLCNLACAVVLYGTGWLGLVGSVLTALLLLMDTVLSIISYFEQQQAARVNLLRYQADREQLQRRIQTLQSGVLTKSEQGTLAVLHQALLAVQRSEVEALRRQKYQRYGALLDLSYAITLLLAFALVCCVFCPPLMLLASIGTALCFSLNVAYVSIGFHLKAAQSSEIAVNSAQDLQTYLRQFIANAAGDDAALKQCYCLCMAAHQALITARSEASRQRWLGLVSVLRDVFIPVLFIVSLTCMPLPFGIPLLLVGIAFALWLPSMLGLNEVKKPDEWVFETRAFELARKNAQSFAARSEGFFTERKAMDQVCRLVLDAPLPV